MIVSYVCFGICTSNIVYQEAPVIAVDTYCYEFFFFFKEKTPFQTVATFTHGQLENSSTQMQNDFQSYRGTQMWKVLSQSLYSD